MLELLELKEDDRILDIGCGSDWSTALLAQTAKSGFVTGVELVPELLDLARSNLEKYHFANIKLQDSWRGSRYSRADVRQNPGICRRRRTSFRTDPTAESRRYHGDSHPEQHGCDF